MIRFRPVPVPAPQHWPEHTWGFSVVIDPIRVQNARLSTDLDDRGEKSLKMPLVPTP
jgi:hypothetical protein